MTVSVEWLDLAALRGDVVEQWAHLADHALEPNPFLDPLYLVPALRHLASDAGAVGVAAAWREAGGERRLVGLMPVARARRTKRLPVASVGTWDHIHAMHGTPLLDADDAADACQGLLEWLLRGPRRAPLVRLTRISGDGPFAATFEAACAALGVQPWVDRTSLRPVLMPTGSADDYIKGAMKGRNRGNLARRLRRLAEEGAVDFEAGVGASAESAARALMTIEAGGWKGAHGTAMARSEAESAFFIEVLRGFEEQGRLRCLSLHLDGAPIAMRTSLVAGTEAFTFKLTYDEAYERFSPGTQLELESIRRTFAEPALTRMDSCASLESSPMFRLWKDRRDVRTVLIPASAVGRAVVRAIPLLERLRRSASSSADSSAESS